MRRTQDLRIAAYHPKRRMRASVWPRAANKTITYPGGLRHPLVLLQGISSRAHGLIGPRKWPAGRAPRAHSIAAHTRAGVAGMAIFATPRGASASSAVGLVRLVCIATRAHSMRRPPACPKARRRSPSHRYGRAGRGPRPAAASRRGASQPPTSKTRARQPGSARRCHYQAALSALGLAPVATAKAGRASIAFIQRDSSGKPASRSGSRGNARRSARARYRQASGGRARTTIFQR